MIGRFLSSTLCFVLAPLLVAQDMATTPVTTAAESGRTLAMLPRGTEVKLLLLESVSASKAENGQEVRMAVAEDVRANGAVVIPKNTPAMGKVNELIKPVSGKRNGYLSVNPASLKLPDGTGIKLREYSPGEDSCGDFGPCWVLYTLFGPLVLIGLIKTSIENRKLSEAGTDRTEHAGSVLSGYTGRDLRLRPIETVTKAH